MDYEFTLKGVMPLLMHADDVMAADELDAWRKNPANKSVSVPGDDRSPPFTWQTYLYHDGDNLAMPASCIMAALRGAGAKISAKKGSFKAMSQSGLLITTDYCEFTNNGKPIRIADIVRYKDGTFKRHLDETHKLGFDLLVKRAKIGPKKHVRVRPMFKAWEVKGIIGVSEPAITEDVLTQLFEIGGRLIGLCDWRPGSPSSPGNFGMFVSSVRLHAGGKTARKVG